MTTEQTRSHQPVMLLGTARPKGSARAHMQAMLLDQHRMPALLAGELTALSTVTLESVPLLGTIQRGVPVTVTALRALRLLPQAT